MSKDPELRKKAEKLLADLSEKAERGGYHINPDAEMALSLCEGLVTNLLRHGYMGCPCRLLEGDKIKDLDIICPCDYRDPDLKDHGACYCALYVSQDVKDGKIEVGSIPERRPEEDERKELAKKRRTSPRSAGIKVWRCKVCGYLCAREHPPEICPVCYAKRDRFETFPLLPKSSGGKDPKPGDDPGG